MKNKTIIKVLVMAPFALVMLNACAPENETSMDQQEFGQTHEGQTAHLFTMQNENGLEVAITNFGGIVTSIKSPNRDGHVENIVLGFEDFDNYLQEHPFFGAIIGRYANRIADGRFELDGETYQLATNDGDNHLHGGEQGFDKVLWEYEILGENSLALSYVSEDGEEGYPGTLEVRVIYTLTPENELSIDYEAETDQATPVNLTNHSYFNLSGDQTEGILDHELTINAGQYTPVDDGLIPTGELTDVQGTPFDFTSSERIGSRIDEVEGGYDHNYVVDHDQNDLKQVARLYEETSGRVMEVYTDKPGLQFYSGNFLDGTLQDPDGRPIEQYAALCLETQYFPDSPNQEHFPNTILREGEVYRSQTVYSFGTE